MPLATGKVGLAYNVATIVHAKNNCKFIAKITEVGHNPVLPFEATLRRYLRIYYHWARIPAI